MKYKWKTTNKIISISQYYTFIGFIIKKKTIIKPSKTIGSWLHDRITPYKFTRPSGHRGLGCSLREVQKSNIATSMMWLLLISHFWHLRCRTPNFPRFFLIWNGCNVCCIPLQI